MTTPRKKAYRINEAAAIAGVSAQYLRNAIKSTDDSVIPHLKAKYVGGSNGFIVLDADLDDFLTRLQDA